MCDCKTESPAVGYAKGAPSAQAANLEQLQKGAAYANSIAGLDSHSRELRGENNIRKQVIADHAAEFKKQIDRLPYGLMKDIAKIKIDEAEFWALKSFEGK